ncbi:class I adenylate-forming enzyme family protein [Paenibacillus aurantius]|uniref:Class I adenylate-forming enzyme family protein n=1 Tax=Paenibacillus aurantius TaxID=2918900 RepID=A0AA96RGA1_9BACL|nr:class I adenylate-forming enzyme family protein [Paenibacillus aurantius]WNQ12311.1 class I adenylate-forming enzyme family protein [Paenibacillus aurantius]
MIGRYKEHEGRIKGLAPRSLPGLLAERAAKSPEDTAYLFPETEQAYTWSSVWKEVQSLACGLLELPVRKGDRVALLMTGRMEMVLSLYAAGCIGAVAVPLNAYSRKKELRAYLEDARPAVLILGREGHGQHYPALLREMIRESMTDGEDLSWLPSRVYVLGEDPAACAPFRPFAELTAAGRGADTREPFLAACRSVHEDDPLVLLYTSGTTGTPKAVLRSAASFLPPARNKGIAGEWAARVTDRLTRGFPVLNLLPLYHLGGFGTILTNLHTCSIPIVMLRHYHPGRALAQLSACRCRVLIGTPYMIQRMVASPERASYDLRPLLGVVFTSAAVTANVLRKVIEELELSFFLVSYGSSEAGSVSNGACFLPNRSRPLLSILYRLLKAAGLLSGMVKPEAFEGTAGSLAGKIEKGVELRILHPETGRLQPPYEPGEIAVRSHRVMRYAKETGDRPSHTGDGWYRSGDIGYVDGEGNLTISGRLNRLIHRGGEKISPAEIEGVLLGHPEVDEAFVLGLPDELYGEQVCACVVAREGAGLTPDKLRGFAAPQLAAFKLPQTIVFLPELPLSPSGKIAVPEIRAALEGRGEWKKHA